MDDELKRHIAELEGKVRELEARWAEVPWLLLRYAIQGELDDAEYEQMRAWLAAHAPKEPQP